jgi:hypothetical protein
MNSIFKWLVGTNYVQSAILKAARNALLGLGSTLLTYLLAHGVSNDLATQLVAGLVFSGMIAAGLGLSYLDLKVVGKKIDIALATPTPEQIQQMLQPNIKN